jgi:magnesium-transporting ATPase (P-type)
MEIQRNKVAWHALSHAAALEQLGVHESGLTEAEAKARLDRYGRNELPREPRPALWQILLRQFRNPLINILGLAAILSLATNHVSDAGFIGAVLCLNAIIGGVQEWKAERSALALQKLLKVRASVERDGDVEDIDAEQVVPGDIVWLESGNRVPADIRLLTSHGTEIDESLLTGESLSVAKDAGWCGKAATVLADRINMAHAGSIVVRGRAKGLVVETGTATEVGQLALDVFKSSAAKPPLLVRMERFTKVIAVAVLVAAVLVAAFGILVRGQGLTEMLLFAVALAVSAIPEGLPVAMTIALAIAATRMARRGVIVRKLAAVEGLGSCTLVATDKTGTLTANELTVREIRLPTGETYRVSGEGFAPIGEVLRDDQPIEPGGSAALEALARTAVLCNEADLHHRDGTWAWRGDPVDIAFLTMAHKLGWVHEKTLDLHPQVNQIPFEPERQFAASYNEVDGATRVLVKGGPERVLGMCSHDEATARELMKVAEDMASRGYRVLALAEAACAEPVDSARVPPEPANLTFLGFVGMIDALRTGVREAVENCQKAGVQVCMVTGDHRVTALAIARDLGLATSDDQVVTGAQLIETPPEKLPELIQQTTIFARVAPHQKLQIVEAARRAGHFVAVTGDGVNDAPALRSANIGVAMGKGGTDVAREAAELVISDDNFATIVAGIEEGRIAYDNIRKVIYLLISTGAAEIVLVGLAVITDTPLPLLPVQLLWLNLVTNGIQDVALAFEPGEGDVLRRAPRPPKDRIFNRLMIERTVIAAVVMSCVGFGLFYWLLPANYTPVQLAAAQNSLLLLMVLFENVHIGNCRSETKSAFIMSPLRSPILLGGVVAAFLVHLAAMYFPPMQKVLGTSPVEPWQWSVLIGLSLTVFVAMEIHKVVWAYRNRATSVAADTTNRADAP